jgi:signal transduction histidine kinase
MISDLLEAQRLKNPYGSLHLEDIEVDDLVRQQADRYAERKPGTVFIETAQPIQLHADPKRITTLVRNLIENAQKYSPPNSGPVEISVIPEESQVIIHVRDYGPGIPEAEIEKVFEPFYRIDKSRTRSTGGYGLGLPLCRKIVEAHGGTLTLRNVSGGGILAEVKLPLAPPVS